MDAKSHSKSTSTSDDIVLGMQSSNKKKEENDTSEIIFETSIETSEISLHVRSHESNSSGNRRHSSRRNRSSQCRKCSKSRSRRNSTVKISISRKRSTTKKVSKVKPLNTTEKKKPEQSAKSSQFTASKWWQARRDFGHITNLLSFQPIKVVEPDVIFFGTPERDSKRTTFDQPSDQSIRNHRKSIFSQKLYRQSLHYIQTITRIFLFGVVLSIQTIFSIYLIKYTHDCDEHSRI